MTLRSRKGTDGGTAQSKKIWLMVIRVVVPLVAKSGFYLLLAPKQLGEWQEALIQMRLVCKKETSWLTQTRKKTALTTVSYRANIALLFVSLDTV